MKLLLVFIIISVQVTALEITEIMYDPGQCPDSKCEWIELYNPTNTTNLSNCFLDGKKMQGVIAEQSYVIIIKDQELFKEHFSGNGNISLVELSFNLKNTGDTINLTCEQTVEFIEYLGDSARGNNFSLERRSDGTWGESLVQGGTPGKVNSIWNVSLQFTDLKINEIMSDPFGADDARKPNGEWIEIFNSGGKNIDLRGLILTDEKGKLPLADTKVLSGMIICPHCYKTIYRDGDSDFALNTEYDVVTLLDGGFIVDSVSYAGSTEGMSWSKIDDNWYSTIPTPGLENNYTTGCDWQITLDQGNSIHNDLDFVVTIQRNYGGAGMLTIRGQIEDQFGHVIKEYQPWTDKPVLTSVTKKYTPNLPENVYQISFWIEKINCQDQKLSNNEVNKLVVVNPVYKKNESSIEIGELYLGRDDTVNWGDQFRVKINIYKGDETKYSVQVYAKQDDKISKTTKISIFDPFKSYNLTLPIQLNPNCNGDDGKASLVVEAFGLQQEKSFRIEGVDGEVCKDYLDFIDDQEKTNSQFYPNVPATSIVGDQIKLSLDILNDELEQDYEIWSYVYRGNKCYSCQSSQISKESNLLRKHLRENEAFLVEQVLTLDPIMDPGNYKVKIKVRKSNQKTTTDFTEEVLVLERKEIKDIQQVTGILSDVGAIESEIFSTMGTRKMETTGMVVYESSSIKAGKLLPYLLAFTFGLLCLAFLFQKT